MRISRRSFLKLPAAGLGLAVRLPARAQAPTEINAWILVEPDDTVRIRYARSEMGQGSMTSTAQLVAEELDCDWGRVRVEYVQTRQQVVRERKWGDMASTQSATIRRSQEYLRAAGAAAREMLVAAAAFAWKVPAVECSTAGGVVMHRRSRRRSTYGQLATAAAELPLPSRVELRDAGQWRVAGSAIARVDIPDIVTGKARYGGDTDLPGMLHAAIVQCPVFGGRLRAIDAAPVRRLRGVVAVLPLGDFVAVVADNWWRASEALKALPLEWDLGESGVSSETLLQYLREGLDEPGEAARREGAPEAVLAYSQNVIEADYFMPFLPHATLEPQSCTALFRDGRVDIWTSTQDAEATHAAATAAAGVPPSHVYVHRTPAGGAFGRRLMQDTTRQAVAVAKALRGVPVKTLWSREEDMRHDFYRPASLVRMQAALDESGGPLALAVHVSAPSSEGLLPLAAFVDLPYAIPHLRVALVPRPMPVRVGLWRGAGTTQNAFARECFVDELARAAGRDPLELRRRLLPAESGEAKVLQATLKAARWDVPASRGLYRGVAVSAGFGSFSAALAELTVGEAGRFEIRRVVIGIDPGHVVNPDNVVAQVQGSTAFALTALLWGEVTFQAGRVAQSNFHDQRMLRLREMPRVEVVLAPSGGFWGGVGAAAVAPVAPAIANALVAATGRPIRSLPLLRAGLALAA
jgi:isoquinoline 1-oxidoreductase subunit beta